MYQRKLFCTQAKVYPDETAAEELSYQGILEFANTKHVTQGYNELNQS